MLQPTTLLSGKKLHIKENTILINSESQSYGKFQKDMESNSAEAGDLGNNPWYKYQK